MAIRKRLNLHVPCSARKTFLHGARGFATFQRLEALFPGKKKKHSCSTSAHQMHFIGNELRGETEAGEKIHCASACCLHTEYSNKQCCLSKGDHFPFRIHSVGHLLRHLRIPYTYWPLRESETGLAHADTCTQLLGPSLGANEHLSFSIHYSCSFVVEHRQRLQSFRSLHSVFHSMDLAVFESGWLSIRPKLADKASEEMLSALNSPSRMDDGIRYAEM